MGRLWRGKNYYEETLRSLLLIPHWYNGPVRQKGYTEAADADRANDRLRLPHADLLYGVSPWICRMNR